MKRGYKVTDKMRKKLIGIACETLSELIEKGRQKLNIEDEVTAALHDGTIVDDEEYFRSLPSQTILILYRKHEDITTGVDFVLDVLRRVNDTYLQTGFKAREVLLEKTHELIEMLKCSGPGDVSKNSREEDPEWFEGLETNARTKDEFMNRRSQDRIRGYLYKFQEDVRKSDLYVRNNSARGVIRDLIDFFKNRLKSDGFFGCYFDRRCADRGADRRHITISRISRRGKRIKLMKKSEETEEPNHYDTFSYCDVFGNFTCQGMWRVQKCQFSSEHRINPYSSKKARILFSTWNLDHREREREREREKENGFCCGCSEMQNTRTGIEKSRSVLPTLLKAVENCPKHQSVNFLYFYQLLFTKCNLKLVHIVCHDKSVHDVSCDTERLYS